MRLNFSPENWSEELHRLLGERCHLLRPHSQLLPSGLRLRKDRPQQSETELRDRFLNRRVSSWCWCWCWCCCCYCWCCCICCWCCRCSCSWSCCCSCCCCCSCSCSCSCCCCCSCCDCSTVVVVDAIVDVALMAFISLKFRYNCV